MNHSSQLNKTFNPKFITQFDCNKENNRSCVLKEKGGNKLESKLRVIKLEEELKKGQAEKQKLRKEVKRLKQLKGLSQEKGLKVNKHLSRDKLEFMKESKNSSNLKKLKRQIADNKCVEPISELQKLQEENSSLKDDNNRYKTDKVEL